MVPVTCACSNAELDPKRQQSETQQTAIVSLPTFNISSPPEYSKYPPAEPGALFCEPLKAA